MAELRPVAGGITSSASLLDTRESISLWSGFPGNIAPIFTATWRWSKRRSVASFLARPWQAKHLSAKIGRMSRLYCKGAAESAAAEPAAKSTGSKYRRASIGVHMKLNQAGSGGAVSTTGHAQVFRRDLGYLPFYHIRACL